MLVVKAIILERFIKDNKTGKVEWDNFGSLIRVIEEEKAIDTQYSFKSYDSLQKLMDVTTLIRQDYTIFRGRPYIAISRSDFGKKATRYYKNDIVDEKIRTRFVDYNVTLSWLFQHCPTEICLRYIKERGIAIEEILK